MATANDRIFDKLDQLTEGVGEVKREIAGAAMQIEQLANHQKEANHRTQKAEERIAALEEENVANANREAYAAGLKAGAAGMLLSKKQITAGAALIGIIVSIAELIVKVVS